MSKRKSSRKLGYRRRRPTDNKDTLDGRHPYPEPKDLLVGVIGPTGASYDAPEVNRGDTDTKGLRKVQGGRRVDMGRNGVGGVRVPTDDYSLPSELSLNGGPSFHLVGFPPVNK